MDLQIKEKTISLIDSLKSTCQTYGMGNDGNEYKIITQVFLYKYLNDKFGYEIKKLDKRIASAEKWEIAYSELSEDDREDLFDTMNPDVPRLNPEHLISHLWNQQAKVSEDVAIKLIAKYEAEQKALSVEVTELEETLSTIRQDEEDVELFIERLRKYNDVQELTREMCLELIEYITLDAYVEGQPRNIYIYYKLLDEPLKDKRSLF